MGKSDNKWYVNWEIDKECIWANQLNDELL